MVFQQGEFSMNKYLKGGIGIIVGIVVIVSVLVLTGAWDVLIDYYNQTDSNVVLSNVVFLIVAAIAIAIVVLPKKGDSNEKEEKK